MVAEGQEARCLGSFLREDKLAGEAPPLLILWVGAVLDETQRAPRLQNTTTDGRSYRPSVSVAINLKVLAH